MPLQQKKPVNTLELFQYFDAAGWKKTENNEICNSNKDCIRGSWILNEENKGLWQLYKIKKQPGLGGNTFLGNIAASNTKNQTNATSNFFLEDCQKAAKTLAFGVALEAAIKTHYSLKGYRGEIWISPYKKPSNIYIPFPPRLMEQIPLQQTFINKDGLCIAPLRQIFCLTIPSTAHEKMQIWNLHPNISVTKDTINL